MPLGVEGVGAGAGADGDGADARGRAAGVGLLGFARSGRRGGECGVGAVGDAGELGGEALGQGRLQRAEFPFAVVAGEAEGEGAGLAGGAGLRCRRSGRGEGAGRGAERRRRCRPGPSRRRSWPSCWRRGPRACPRGRGWPRWSKLPQVTGVASGARGAFLEADGQVLGGQLRVVGEDGGQLAGLLVGDGDAGELDVDPVASEFSSWIRRRNLPSELPPPIGRSPGWGFSR